MSKASRLAAACAVALALNAGAADGQLAPNAPKDAPVRSDSIAQLHAQIAPYVAQARASYPQAKARYLAGLPKAESFFVTVPLTDAEGNEELVFVSVRRIADGQVTGVVASTILLVKGFHEHQAITIPESRIIDWLVTKPDGSEEGNVVGKYLDEHGRH